ncbi:hypothetical protein P7C70_g9020, partial [Phenoliferia sp. Uapishka_3]
MLASSSFSSFDGSENVTHYDRRQLSYLPETSTGDIASLPIHQPGPANSYDGVIYRMQSVQSLENTLDTTPALSDFLKYSNFPHRPPPIQPTPDQLRRMTEDVDVAWEYFSDPKLLFDSNPKTDSNSSDSNWTSAPWNQACIRLDTKTLSSKFNNSLSFPPFSSRVHHPLTSFYPGFTHPSLYASSDNPIALPFHIEALEASSVNTSIWTGRGKRQEKQYLNNQHEARDSARIWILVSPLYRARVEAALDREFLTYSNRSIRH